MGRDRDRERGRPVEPREARAHGEDPNAVYIDRDADDERGAASSGRAPRSLERRRQQQQDIDVVERRDSVRWGPIWAGLITALTTFLLLELLALGIGILGNGWVSSIIGLIAFFTGGSVAGMTSAVRGTATGLINGFLVWALGTVLILVLSALGLGQLFGALGNVVGQLGVLQNIQQGGVNAPNVSQQQVLSTIRTAAIGTFFGLLLSALASALGGFLGGRSSDPIGSMPDPDRD